MKIAQACVGQYHLSPYTDWSQYQEHVISQVVAAKKQNAEILLLPEYAGLEMNAGSSEALEDHFESIQEWLEDYLKLYSQLAKQYGVYLQPGTVPYKTRNKTWRNRAYFFHTNGTYGYQDKIYLTKFEKATGLLEGGDQLKIFDTEIAKIAIAICYDAEFPELVSRLTRAGVQLLLVPSCTDSLQGYNRVHVSCRARAIENQIFVANSYTALNSSWSSMIDINIGRAGGFAPSDGTFPEDGILLLGEANKAEQYFIELDFAKLEHCRKEGAVANFNDSQESLSIILKD